MATVQHASVFAGSVDRRGKLTLDDRQAMLEGIRRFAGRRVEVVVRLLERVRSTPANRYYWGVVIALLADDLGYTKAECHEACKRHFLGLDNPDSKLPRVRSTAALSPGAFQRYVDDVRILAADWRGLVIPDPEYRWQER